MKFAVTQGVEPGLRPADFLRQAYPPLCEAIGILPVPVPNVLSDPAQYAAALGLEGLLLTGGGDIAPSRYGAENTHSVEIAVERDSTELRLLEWAIAGGKPVLGICRGMQMINVYFSGSLIQDLPALLPGAVDHAQGTHPVAVTRDGLADLLGGRTLSVNTFHHQGMTAAELAPELEGIAVSEEDGVVEAVWHRALPVLAVQWHPERPGPSAESDRRLLRRFLDGTLWHLRG